MDYCDGPCMSKSRDKTINFDEKIKNYPPGGLVEEDDEDERNVIDFTYAYDMSKFPRGKLVIVNINKIYFESVTFERVGTERDCQDLCELFLSFGFEVNVLEDVKQDELISYMTHLSKQSFMHTNALFIAFLTHGHEKFIFAADGKVEIKSITSLFRGSNIAGKPKVFLIQACQGSEHMEQINPTSLLEVDGTMELVNKMELPVEADFLYAYSTVPGFSSWRSKSGSWFIQIICDVFRKHGRSMDVVRMLTKVNALLSERMSHSDDPLLDGKKQIACVVSQLRKELFLNVPICKKITSEV